MMRPLGILLIFVAVVLGAAGMLLAKRSVFYSSTAVVKVTRDKTDLPELKGFANLASGSGADPDAVFIETEIAIVKSDTTLNAVITQLKLREAWGQRINHGNPLGASQSSQLLKERVEVQPGGEAGRIQIKARSEVPAEAAEIANAVSQAYCEYRADYRRRLAQTALDAVVGKYADTEKQIATNRTKVDQAWQQLDPALQELAATNGSTLGSAIARNLHSQYAELLLRHLTASNQLALFLATNAAPEDWIVEQLKGRVENARTEMARAENSLTNEMRRFDLLKTYQVARMEFEDLTQHFAPLKRTVDELQNDLRPQGQPPASVIEPATAPTSPDVRSVNRNQWILPTAGVALLLGVGLLVAGRTPKKAAA